MISKFVHLDSKSVLKGEFVCVSAAQRSAQELPLVEKQSVESYPATGGKMMLLGGLNFLPESKVVFVEKAQGKLDANLHRLCSLHFNFPS